MSFDISYEELPKTVTRKIRRDAVSRMMLNRKDPPDLKPTR
jgi:acyl-coenzyme A synthetase/AMP-(fatty) acid ligase